MRRGRGGPASALELGVLAGAVRAVAALSPRDREAGARVEIEDDALTITVVAPAAGHA